ncbi:MAG: hypothetical protein ACI85O_000293 [Saprospiraceae bacterium]|jgi:hypothetical protein
MEIIQYTWANLLEIAIFLVVFWFVLLFFRDVFKRTHWFGKSQDTVQRVMDILLLLFEPLAILLLIGVFVFVNPWLHGLTVLMILTGGFNHFRNYLSGRIVRFDKKIDAGKSIRTENAQGIIDSRERLGLRIKTSKGIQFIGYSNLLKNGYMLLADKEIGGFYHLRITPEENNKTKNHLQYLFDLLVTTPFIDHSFKPEFIETEDKADVISMQVSVREKTHLSELTNLIKERGYLCKILKK